MSAYSGKSNREGYDACVDSLTSGDADVMVAWKLDRVHRSLRQFTALVELLGETGARLVTVSDGYDSSDPAQIMVGQMLSMVAENESRNTSIRQKAAIRAAAKRGEPRNGGSRPFGYRPSGKTLEVVEDEAEVVRWLAAEIIAGRSANSLCVELNDRGITTTTGRTWGPTALIRYFRSNTVACIRVDDGETFAGNWEPIVDATTLVRVRDRLAKNSKGKESTAVGLLSGIARCGRCDAPLAYARRVKDDKVISNYTCNRSAKTPNRCGRLGIAVRPTDELVTGLLFDRLDSVRNTRDDGDRDAQIERTVSALDEQAARFEELLNDYHAERGRTRDAYESVAGKIAARIDALQHQLDALRSDVPRVEVEDVRSWWATATLTERRDLLRQHIEALPVAPSGPIGNQYRPERVTDGLRWRS